jgi:hypothetical protein
MGDSQGMYHRICMNICMLFLRPSYHTKWIYFPLTLAAGGTSKKVVKYLIFNTIYHVCICVDRIEQKYMQKSDHKSLKKKRKWGQGAGMSRGVGWIRQG